MTLEASLHIDKCPCEVKLGSLLDQRDVMKSKCVFSWMSETCQINVNELEHRQRLAGQLRRN